MNKPWTPFEEVVLPRTTAVLRTAMWNDPESQCFVNSRYQVIVSRLYSYDEKGNRSKHCVTSLSIKRHDKTPAHDWREFQRIKNELVGPEVMAIEVYPPESKLVDTANQYFLWCVPDTWQESIFGFTFQMRLVSETPGGGARQRPWPADCRPADLKSEAEMDVLTSQTLREANG